MRWFLTISVLNIITFQERSQLNHRPHYPLLGFFCFYKLTHFSCFSINSLNSFKFTGTRTGLFKNSQDHCLHSSQYLIPLLFAHSSLFLNHENLVLPQWQLQFSTFISPSYQPYDPYQEIHSWYRLHIVFVVIAKLFDEALVFLS